MIKYYGLEIIKSIINNLSLGNNTKKDVKVKFKVGEEFTPYIGWDTINSKLVFSHDGVNQLNIDESLIESISVNGTVIPISNKNIDLTIPTKISDLNNDKNFAENIIESIKFNGSELNINNKSVNIISIEILSTLPEVTIDDDGRVAIYIGSNTETLSQGHLYLVISGTWTDISKYTAGTGIVINNGIISIDTDDATDGHVLTKTTDGIEWTDNVVHKKVIVCPEFDSTMHLVVKVSDNDDFSDAETIIDTINNLGTDRIQAFNGTEFIQITDSGLVPIYSGQAVKIDMTGYYNINFLYKWTSVDGDSDWYATYYPGSSEAKSLSVRTADVQYALGISPSTGDNSKVLSQRGTFVQLPEDGSGSGSGEGTDKDEVLRMILAFS